jgi:hypothetical protein
VKEKKMSFSISGWKFIFNLGFLVVLVLEELFSKTHL